MVRIEGEPFWFMFPRSADELVRCEAAEALEPSAEVVGGDEVVEVLSELLMALVVKALTVASLMVRFIRSIWPLVQG